MPDLATIGICLGLIVGVKVTYGAWEMSCCGARDGLAAGEVTGGCFWFAQQEMGKTGGLRGEAGGRGLERTRGCLACTSAWGKCELRKGNPASSHGKPARKLDRAKEKWVC